MAVVRSDRIGVPTGLNERRELAWLRSCADDSLAGRVVWSVASLPDGHVAGRRLRELLRDSTEVAPMGVEAAEAALGELVGPGDVVILHDSFTVSSATALRDRGAHTIWHLRRQSATRAPSVREAIDFLDRGGGAVDAVALAWTSLLGDIVEEDRTDHVGGTIQVRPVVAAR
jgi:hypothetical protein